MIRSFAGSLTAAAFLLLPISSAAQVSAWGDLTPGPFRVGYRIRAVSDSARPSLIGPPQDGRAIVVSIWYPAAETGKKMPMSARDYVRGPAVNAKAPALTADSVDARFQQALSRSVAADGVDRVMEQRLFAVEGARAADRKSPLILFLHADPVQQSVMAEYLASYGFVVAAVVSQGARYPQYTLNAPNVEAIAADARIGMVAASRMLSLDGRIAVIGMSNGSLAAMLLASADPRVRAIVSLDGSITEASAAAMLNQFPSFEGDRVRVPLLHFYTKENPLLDLAPLESFRYSDRILAEFPTLRHGDFLAGPALNRVGRQAEAADTPNDPVIAFFGICRATLAFIRATLSGQALSAELVARNIRATRNVSVITGRIRSLGTPLLTEKLIALLQLNRLDSAIELESVARGRGANPAITRRTFEELTSWVLNYSPAMSRPFLDWYVSSDSTSSRAHFRLANLMLAARDSASAKQAMRRARSLSETDSSLDATMRRRIDVASRALLQ